MDVMLSRPTTSLIDIERPRLVRTGAEFHNPVDRWSPGLRLAGEVRRKRNLYFGTVQIFLSETQVATVDAVLVVLEPR